MAYESRKAPLTAITHSTKVAEEPLNQGNSNLTAWRRFGTFMSVVGITTVPAGALLYRRDSGFQLSWMATVPGLGFTLGGVAGIVVVGLGYFMIGLRGTPGHPGPPDRGRRRAAFG